MGKISFSNPNLVNIYEAFDRRLSVFGRKINKQAATRVSKSVYDREI